VDARLGDQAQDERGDQYQRHGDEPGARSAADRVDEPRLLWQYPGAELADVDFF
jgi:hypothetical protein